MNQKQLTTLLVLVVVLGGIGLAVYKKNTTSWQSSSTKSSGKIVNLPLNDVAQIHIKKADGELTIEKTNEVWSVKERGGYPANYEQVSGFIRKIWELKPVQDVKVGPSQFARLELVEPGQGGARGTLVEFKDKDGKAVGALLIGKSYLKKDESGFGGGEGFPAGRYVMAKDGSKRVALVSETFSEVEPKPEQWLDREFFQIEKPKTIALSGTSPAMAWKLKRDNENGEWQLADAKPDEKVDSAKTGAFANLFSSPSFGDVLLPDAKPETTGLDKPSTATFETFDGFVYTLKIGKLTGENYPLAISVSATLPKERTPGKDEKPEDKKKLDEEFQAKTKRLEEKLAKEKKFEKRIYLVPKYTCEQLFKDRAQLLVEKKPEPTPAPSPAGTSVTTPPVAAPTPLPLPPGTQ